MFELFYLFDVSVLYYIYEAHLRLNIRTIMKLRTSIVGSTVFDPFNHWVDSTYRESGSPTLLRYVIIDDDVVSETISNLKHDSFI